MAGWRWRSRHDGRSSTSRAQVDRRCTRSDAAGHAALPSRRALRGRARCSRSIAAEGHLPIAVRHRHEQRRTHGPARWRPVAVGARGCSPGVYDAAPATARPMYGSLDDRRSPYGGSPRFGSAYFQLDPQALDRVTFCFPDSVLEPTDVGTVRPDGTAPARSRTVISMRSIATSRPRPTAVSSIDRDVSTLVLDPSYRGSPIESAGAPPAVRAALALRLPRRDRRDPRAPDVPWCRHRRGGRRDRGRRRADAGPHRRRPARGTIRPPDREADLALPRPVRASRPGVRDRTATIRGRPT